jgi:hypothetical protein
MMAAMEVPYLSYGIGTLKIPPLASAIPLARHTSGSNDDASVYDNSDGNAFEEQEHGEEIPFIAPNTPYSGNYPEDLSHQEIRQTAISNSPESPHNDVDTYGGARTKDYQISLSRIESLDSVPDHSCSNNLRAGVGVRHTGLGEDVSQAQVSNGSRRRSKTTTGIESR